MTLAVAIMYGIAALAAAAGAWLLLRLRNPLGEARIYAYRMTGIMALALGTVLAMSATAMWSWSVKA